jgi:hypothetical protein
MEKTIAEIQFHPFKEWNRYPDELRFQSSDIDVEVFIMFAALYYIIESQSNFPCKFIVW